MKITRPLVYFNVENKNGRIYTQEEFMPKVKVDILPKIEEGRMFGELGHPDNCEISLKNISHRIKNVYEKDDKLYGDLELLDTDAGNFVKENLHQFVFRPRSSGVINADKTITIHQIFTFDAVYKDEDSFQKYASDEINDKTEAATGKMTFLDKIKLWIYNNIYYKFF
jgi:hypothetical protein